MESTSEELKRYVRFSLADAELVASVAADAARHFERIASEFYERLFDGEDGHRVLGGDDRIAGLETSMVAWLTRLFEGNYDESYFEASKALGRLHVDIGLPSRQVSASMSTLRSALSAVVARSATNLDEAIRIIDAVSRRIDLDLIFMLDGYHEHFAATRIRNEEARRLSSLGTLTAGLAHEIRNPLNGARLHVAFLARELSGRASKEATEAVLVIDREIDRLARLLSDFLEYAEPRPLDRVAISASTFIARCAAAVRPLAFSREVSLELDVAPGDVTFEADPVRLERAIVNLLTNALEAVSRGGTARVRSRREGTDVRFEVEDDGPGTPEKAPLFDPFYSTKPSGTGLGLSVAHRIIADHGGTIDVDSRPGRTVFRVHIPGQSEGWET